MRGIKVDAMATNGCHTLALVDDGSVYTWGDADAAREGALRQGFSGNYESRVVRIPRRIRRYM
jgi:alpha-tubulin suppressor-like RCC1 family protein